MDLVPRSHAPDHLAARPRARLGADLPALRTELVQLLEYARCIVSAGYGLILDKLHRSHLLKLAPGPLGELHDVAGRVSAVQSPVVAEHL